MASDSDAPNEPTANRRQRSDDMPPSNSSGRRPHASQKPSVAWIWRFLLGLGLFAAAALLAAGLALALAYPRLPELDALTDYRPKIPLRIFTADGTLIGEFGEERRSVVALRDVPDVLKQAVLAAEDDRFFEHSGVDFAGVLRAALANFGAGGRVQGASTLTMQLARNFYLSSEKTVARKALEVLLALRIEASLSKEQILEIYLNQIYLGRRAYGFASAARIYYGKSLSQLTASEAAMLAGLPKAPSAYNPSVNKPRAQQRQRYVLSRMHKLGYLNDSQYEEAMKEDPPVRTEGEEFSVKAPYVAEMVRQLMYEQFREETYSRGFSVYTTVRDADQIAAYQAVRTGILEYDRKYGYRGPEGFVDLPRDRAKLDDVIDLRLVEHPDSDDLIAAVVLEATPKRVVVRTRKGSEFEITSEGLRFAAASLSANAQPARAIRRGAIVRIGKNAKTGAPEILQMPEVEAAFIATNSVDGAVRAMIGGFDFNRNKFNRVTQAWRQPGSAFKPFIYSASLEKKFAPATLINDAPIFFDSAQTGGQPWEPKNYDGRFDGPMRMRQGLAKSKNMVSIRLLQSIRPKYAQEFVSRFGFLPEKNPPYLTLALGAGSVTLWQMAAGYGVFANGGYYVEPYVIERVIDASGHVVARADRQKAGEGAARALDARNAFIMDSMLKDVVRFGTAAKARALGRNDLAGKTGTTNDAFDAWFAGYQPSIVAVAWVGFDQPRKLGERETGGGLALPIWMQYMAKALKGVPEMPFAVPDGVVSIGGDYFYRELGPDGSVRGLGLSDPLPNERQDPGSILNGDVLRQNDPPGQPEPFRQFN